ncbi:16S rRNA (cytosine(1402)-N(4))-methyltransferase, partial [Opitutaceae bacterium]|nr:16S rRNA (cytosine(1402)-N(4))-methyltransferase [Opitutaceae bacterium]
PLDMRMNPETGISAADWLASASRRELIQAIRVYGEEKNWRRIVDAIIEARTQSPLKSTQDLSELILSCTPARLRFASKIHPATKTFQGIRIAVNNEIDVIEVGLPAAFKRLKPNGRLCVISFHSLEDRIAKNLFRRWAGHLWHAIWRRGREGPLASRNRIVDTGWQLRLSIPFLRRAQHRNLLLRPATKIGGH